MKATKKLTVKGFVRTAMTNVKTGETVLSPWVQNAITADGFQNYICGPLGAIAGSKTVGYMAIASQTTAPSSSQTSASGEMDTRKATSNSFVANGTMQATASWATNEATQSNIGAIALYNTSSGGTCACVATFSTSAKTTDQTLSCTYQLRFS